MDLLLAVGADLGKQRADTPPLHAAAQRHCCGAIQRLISAGASVHQLDSGGRLVLHRTCLHNCEGAVKLLLRYNARMTLICDEGLFPLDVVAVTVLNRRENNGLFRCLPLSWRSPSTLNADETSVSDHIHDLLRKASGWRRRGWLVLMRHRIAHDHLAASSSPPPSFVESAFGDQTATPNDSETKENANDGGGELPRDGDINSSGASPRGTAPSEAFEGGTGHVFTLQTSAVDSSMPNGGGKAKVCDSLRWAVEWLVQCPDEVGVSYVTLASL